MKKTKFGPTLACVNLMDVKSDVEVLDELGADTYHIDIMDGCFVPNYCLSWDFIRQLIEITDTPVDVHLMTENVDRDIDTALSLSIDALAFHVEAIGDTEGRIRRIKEHRVKAGLAICPSTPIGEVEKWLGFVDYVLLMGVKPGFFGQKFLQETFGRLQTLCSIRKSSQLALEIYVDGGIDFEVAKRCVEIGADILVAGKPTIFREKGKLREDTLRLRQMLGRP